jgi:hypothetical protein
MEDVSANVVTKRYEIHFPFQKIGCDERLRVKTFIILTIDFKVIEFFASISNVDEEVFQLHFASTQSCTTIFPSAAEDLFQTVRPSPD